MKKYFYLAGLTRAVKTLENEFDGIVNELRAFPNAAQVAANEIINLEYLIDMIEREVLKAAEREKQTVVRSAIRMAL